MTFQAEVRVTMHALGQYRERLVKLGVKEPLDLEEALRSLLQKSTEDDKMTPGRRTQRLINNNMEAAHYRTYRGWRFVLTEDGTVLRTVERVKPSQN